MISKGDSLLIKAGISHTSTENARLNLEAEVPGWDFINVKDEAKKLDCMAYEKL